MHALLPLVWVAKRSFSLTERNLHHLLTNSYSLNMRLTLASTLAILSAASAFASPTKRQTDGATCEVVLKPETPPPSGIDLGTEFRFVIGRTLATAVSPAIISDSGAIVTENADDTFTIDDTLFVEGKTGPEIAAILTSFAGLTEPGFSGTEWDFQSAACE